MPSSPGSPSTPDLAHPGHLPRGAAQLIGAAEALAIHPTTGDVYVAGVHSASNFPGTAGGAAGARRLAFRMPSSPASPAPRLHSPRPPTSGAAALTWRAPWRSTPRPATSTWPASPTPATSRYTPGAQPAYRWRLRCLRRAASQHPDLAHPGHLPRGQRHRVGDRPGDPPHDWRRLRDRLHHLEQLARYRGRSRQSVVARCLRRRFPSTLTSLIHGHLPRGRRLRHGARALAIHPTTGDVYRGRPSPPPAAFPAPPGAQPAIRWFGQDASSRG